MTTKKYDLFLSYNSADREIVTKILDELKALPTPLKTFIDKDSLTLGKNWFVEIENALLNSRAVAIFYGKNGLGRWQNLEMILSLDLQATKPDSNNNTLVIPILLPGADLEKAPRFLLLNSFLDLRSPDSAGNLHKLVQTVSQANSSIQALANLDTLEQQDILRNPYRGLDYFREEDARLFFGRQAISAKLLEKTKQLALIALVGNSGTGKSSVVRAGLIPLLRKQHSPDPSWEVLVCIPAANKNNPFHNLATVFLDSWDYAADAVVTARPGLEATLRSTLSLSDSISQTLKTSQNADRLLIIIDQFEELLNFEDTPNTTGNPSQAKSDFELFVELLLNTIKADNCTILLTIRGDYYGAVTERHAGLGEEIAKGTITLSRLADDQLREIIEAPADLGHGHFEKGLVDVILNEVKKQPGNLALLEFALTALWNHQVDGTLTHDAYNTQVGKLEGAISKKADEILNSKKLVSDPKLALTALTRLVRVTSAEEEGGDTRQRVLFKDFSVEERLCLEPFIKSRLLVASGSWLELSAENQQAMSPMPQAQGSAVEVAHEALIRHWPTLQDALKDKRALLIWRQSIREQYEKWVECKKKGAKQADLDYWLLRNYSLAQGLKWYQERPGDLQGKEPQYILESQAKKQQQLLIVRWLKRGSSAILGILLLIAAISWWSEQHNANWRLGFQAVWIRCLYAINFPGITPEWIPEMQEIKPGKFLMGSALGNEEANDQRKREMPQHEVIIKGFRKGTYEVKFSEYQLFVEDTDTDLFRCATKVKPNIDDNKWGKDDNLPAINVSWDDAVCYAQWLSFLTGANFHLPSEAQWEYAARATTTTDYYWGNANPKDFAWFADNSESKTHPVGKRLPNKFGLYDMSGNVWEWVQDSWHENYEGAPENGTVWESGDTTLRVVRGGSWSSKADFLRSGVRYGFNPDYRNFYIGFRLAQD